MGNGGEIKPMTLIDITPRYIKDHPGVAYYCPGSCQSSDYRHYIELKKGWEVGHDKEGMTSLFFNNKSDFYYYDIREIL